MELEVRPATVSDAEVLADVGRRTFLETYAGTTDAGDLAGYVGEHFTPERMRAELEDGGSRFFVAVVDGEPAGYAKLREGAPPGGSEGRAVELERIYVVRAHQSEGAGGALMERCLAEARAGGFETLWLGVWSENANAMSFYESLGFVRFGEQSFELGRQLQRDYLMRLDLRG